MCPVLKSPNLSTHAIVSCFQHILYISLHAAAKIVILSGAFKEFENCSSINSLYKLQYERVGAVIWTAAISPYMGAVIISSDEVWTLYGNLSSSCSSITDFNTSWSQHWAVSGVTWKGSRKEAADDYQWKVSHSREDSFLETPTRRTKLNKGGMQSLSSPHTDPQTGTLSENDC